jgi:hypothetical protein
MKSLGHLSGELALADPFQFQLCFEWRLRLKMQSFITPVECVVHFRHLWLSRPVLRQQFPPVSLFEQQPCYLIFYYLRLLPPVRSLLPELLRLCEGSFTRRLDALEGVVVLQDF